MCQGVLSLQVCVGSRHIGHCLLCLMVFKPLLVELVRGEVAEGLVGAAGIVYFFVFMLRNGDERGPLPAISVE